MKSLTNESQNIRKVIKSFKAIEKCESFDVYREIIKKTQTKIVIDSLNEKCSTFQLDETLETKFQAFINQHNLSDISPLSRAIFKQEDNLKSFLDNFHKQVLEQLNEKYAEFTEKKIEFTEKFIEFTEKKDKFTEKLKVLNEERASLLESEIKFANLLNNLGDGKIQFSSSDFLTPMRHEKQKKVIEENENSSKENIERKYESLEVEDGVIQKIKEALYQYDKKKNENENISKRDSIVPQNSDNEDVTQIILIHLGRYVLKKNGIEGYELIENNYTSSLNSSNKKIDIIITEKNKDFLSFYNLISFIEIKKDVQTQKRVLFFFSFFLFSFSFLFFFFFFFSFFFLFHL